VGTLSGAGHAGAAGAHSSDLGGPLGPAEVVLVQLSYDQMPEGLEEEVWLHFVELHEARARLDLLVRQQTAQVGGCEPLWPVLWSGAVRDCTGHRCCWVCRYSSRRHR
jgi:hypothetical protein